MLVCQWNPLQMAGAFWVSSKLPSSPHLPRVEWSCCSYTTQPVESIQIPHSLVKVRAAIKKLKNGHAAGLDGITPELLKYAIDLISSGLQALFVKVWQTGRVPADWRDGVIIPLLKGKGSKTDCGSYQPISLLSVPGKVLAHVLLHRLNPLLAEHRRHAAIWFHSREIHCRCNPCSETLCRTALRI